MATALRLARLARSGQEGPRNVRICRRVHCAAPDTVRGAHWHRITAVSLWMLMQTRQVDPRDTRWEVDRPVYRVYFWQRLGSHKDSGWASQEWQVEDADADEVLTWAGSTARDRAFTLYVCCECDGEIGLIRLLGSDPTAQG